METIVVEVAYALPHQQRLMTFEVEQGTSAMTAVERSGIVNEFPEIDLAVNKVGVFGKAIRNADQHELQAGDRVEIYRKLIKK